VLSNYGFNTSTPATYDADDRLTGWNRTDGNKDQSWNLTLVGDWTSFTDESVTETRAHSNVHELTTITGGPNAGSLSYDAKGNLTSNTNSHKYSWDFDNKMSGADTDSNPGNDTTFEYDALGRRVRKNNGTTNTVYALAGQQVIAEYASGTAPTSPAEQYVYGSYIDEPILKDGTGGSVYYSRNQQYSVTALSNSTGSVGERYAYDAYGDLNIFDAAGTLRASSAFNNAITYTGRRFDDESDLYYFRARCFDPRLGRFPGRDSLEYVDGMGIYGAYFGLQGLDPTGNLSILQDGLDKPVVPSGLYRFTRNNPLFKDCTIDIFMGHSNRASIFTGGMVEGDFPEIDEWMEKMRNQYKETGCSGYYGVISCFNVLYNRLIWEKSRIPDWPLDKDRLSGAKCRTMVPDGLGKARNFANKLCSQSVKADRSGIYDPDCGENNCRCNRVTVRVHCAPDMRHLFDTGYGPPNRRGNRPREIPDRQLPAINPCDTNYTIDCFHEWRRPRGKEDYDRMFNDWVY